MKKNRKIELIKCFEEGCNVTVACKRIGIAPKTYYRWLSDPLFASEIYLAEKTGVQMIADLAKTKLEHLAIKETHFPSLRLVLTRTHPEYLDEGRTLNRFRNKRLEKIEESIEGIEEIEQKLIFYIASKDKKKLKKAHNLCKEYNIDPMFFVDNIQKRKTEIDDQSERYLIMLINEGVFDYFCEYLEEEGVIFKTEKK